MAPFISLLTLLVLLVTLGSCSFGNWQQPVILQGDSLKVPGNSPLEYCKEDHSSDILQHKYINIDPNPPAAGQNLTVIGVGTFSKDVEEGAYISIVVKLGSITLVKTKEDFCEQVKTDDLECPIKKGKQTIRKDFEMPEQIPQGKWTVTADVYTKDDERITCLKAVVTFGQGYDTVG